MALQDSIERARTQQETKVEEVLAGLIPKAEHDLAKRLAKGESLPITLRYWEPAEINHPPHYMAWGDTGVREGLTNYFANEGVAVKHKFTGRHTGLILRFSKPKAQKSNNPVVKGAKTFARRLACYGTAMIVVEHNLDFIVPWVMHALGDGLQFLTSLV